MRDAFHSFQENWIRVIRGAVQIALVRKENEVPVSELCKIVKSRLHTIRCLMQQSGEKFEEQNRLVLVQEGLTRSQNMKIVPLGIHLNKVDSMA